MSLVLEVEYLMGVAFASVGPASGVPDWPPQPDRIFSALVSTWGMRGGQESEAQALRWLEEQPAPMILASRAEPRTSSLRYVPPNDPRTGRTGDRAVVPAYRRRQPRRFPAARPHEPIVRFYWSNAEPNESTFQILDRLATDTAYVGHSSSLTRCRFFSQPDLPDRAGLQQSKRRIYEGRLAELRKDYARFLNSSGKVGRPNPGDIVLSSEMPPEEPPRSCFSSDWLILEDVGEWMPDIRAAALVAKEIRDTLLSGYGENSIPSEVSGHEPDGSSTKDPHLAIVPLAYAGYKFADGHLLGFALLPPEGKDLLKQSHFLEALRNVAPLDRTSGRRTISLRRHEVKLSPTISPNERSLQASEYLRPARTFATITPIVLDRHLKKEGAARQQEIIDQIQAACRNIGLPGPIHVFPDKHSAVEGAVSAQPSGNAPAWTRWRLPKSLASRPLTHAVIEFDSPVIGPVLLGAGRFVGLGLCRPIAELELDL